MKNTAIILILLITLSLSCKKENQSHYIVLDGEKYSLVVDNISDYPQIPSYTLNAESDKGRLWFHVCFFAKPTTSGTYTTNDQKGAYNEPQIMPGDIQLTLRDGRSNSYESSYIAPTGSGSATVTASGGTTKIEFTNVPLIRTTPNTSAPSNRVVSGMFLLKN